MTAARRYPHFRAYLCYGTFWIGSNTCVRIKSGCKTKHMTRPQQYTRLCVIRFVSCCHLAGDDSSRVTNRRSCYPLILHMMTCWRVCAGKTLHICLNLCHSPAHSRSGSMHIVGSFRPVGQPAAGYNFLVVGRVDLSGKVLFDKKEHART